MKRWIQQLTPYSLKHRFIYLLLLSVLIPLIPLGSISYLSMNEILENKTKQGIKSNLHQVRLSLDNLLSQLNHVSQMLAFDGQVGKSLENYLNAKALDKKLFYDELRAQLNLIQFTNPSVGLMFYYLADQNTYFFESNPVRKRVELGELPLFDQYNEISYFGPHRTLNMALDRDVISIMRKVNLPDQEQLYIYIESNLNIIGDLFTEFSTNTDYLIIDHKGIIRYSENQASFPIGSVYTRTLEINDNGHYIFEERSNQDWKVVAAISESVYKSEIRSWIIKYIGFALITLLAGLVIAWLMYRSLYRPLRILSQSIRDVKNDNWNKPIEPANMMEFDSIQADFSRMKARVTELLGELAAEEKKKGILEIEKLLSQINPHFLHNTLDTLRWMAREKGHLDMDQIISALIRVLHYNLGKGGPATIRQEIDSVRHYLSIQEKRFEFQFHIHVHAKQHVLDLPIPRFVLQPIVENAIYHGLSDQGKIEITIIEKGSSQIEITIKDDGRGMSPEEIVSIMQPQAQEMVTHSGIGLRYVRKMIEQYGEVGSISVESTPGEGTVFVICLPIGDSEFDRKEVGS
ncbi:sensor histidine kinase [Paenibacillus sp. GXUN7292]|uniref:sensor histidine kinase n=1 Tax=Paenibacillus sp. GXUN7292 TaxID=3422499 RepID=UPI003D7DD7C8